MALIDLSEADKRTVRVSSITLIALALCLSAVGYLSRDSFGPIVIDKVFGITDYVQKSANNRIDSGYSKTFIFHANGADSGQQTLIFYADQNQGLSLFESGSSSPTESHVEIKIDRERLPGEDTDGFDHVYNRDTRWRASPGATKYLSFVSQEQPNFHKITVRPTKFGKNATIVIDCVVLVSNQKPDSGRK